MPGSYLVAILLLLAVGGLATENFSHYPVAIMSLLGVVSCVRGPRATLDSGNAKLLVSIFACIWIPMLLALPDAVNPGRAFKTTALYLHYLPAGLYVIVMLRDPALQRIVLAGIAAILGLWCVDGVLQFTFGSNLLGYPYDGSVLTGAFYPKQRLGLIVAVLAPLYLHVVHRLAARSPAAWILLAPLFVVVALSLKRTAWVMFAASLCIYLACFFRPSARNLRSGLFAALLVTGGVALGMSLIPNLHTQLTGTMKIFTTDFETADVASSRRLSLWKTGVSMVGANWLNGVGPRGYRTVYRDFAETDDFWIARGSSGQTHPHLMLLEIVVETGVIGLAGYFFALMLLLKHISSTRVRDPATCIYLIAAVVAWFPLNAHLAFYGSYWSNIAWIMIALGCVRARDSVSPR